MKLIIFLCLFSSAFSFAEVLELKSGKMEYKVKHLVKTVSAESKDVKGKMDCKENTCEFILGVPVRTFTSSDSNRDSNMLTTTEAGKFPVTSASGKIESEKLKPGSSFKHLIDVVFHGQKKTYEATTKVISPEHFTSSFVLKLDAHGIERPSLFTVKIDDEVPMSLDMEWVRK